LTAVLAHERAHAKGRHDLLLNGPRLLLTAFPSVPLFALAHTQLTRLVEIRADDIAIRHHPRLSLARALVTLAAAMAYQQHEPAAHTVTGAVAATGGDAAERLQRLLNPPLPLPAGYRVVVAVALTVPALLPAATLTVAAAFPSLPCPPLPML
jgi:beta-lactamase regulating signal transducer with metallopeptidase domain